MAAKSKKRNLSTNKKVGIGIGLTAAAVAAAGAYFLYGSPKAKQNRRKVKSWMFNAKAEVLDALERAEDMTGAEYNRLVETVGKTYSKLKDASNADIAYFKKEMKEHWPKIVKEGKKVTRTVSKMVRKTAKKVKKTAKKTVKKTVKRVIKKATKKTAKKVSKKKSKKK